MENNFEFDEQDSLNNENAEYSMEQSIDTPIDMPVDMSVEAPIEIHVEPQVAEEPVQALGFTETGAIGSMAADGPKVDAVSSTDLGNKVALFSTSNVRWPEVGVVYKGYNVVSKSDADKWLTRDHIRTATQEEVEQAFGNL